MPQSADFWYAVTAILLVAIFVVAGKHMLKRQIRREFEEETQHGKDHIEH